MRTLLSGSILSTLSYHSRFSYPLTFDQLHRFLIINRPLSPNKLEPELDKLVKKEKIIESKGFYYLSNSPNYPNFPNLPNIRLKRHQASLPKLRLAARAARLIGIIPWIKLICVTGSLAMENSDPDDDIDLMIVTSQNRLWLARPLVILLVSLFFNRRRHIHSEFRIHHSELKDAICLNLWLDSSALAMPPHRQNSLTAHELAQMKPLVSKNHTYEKILSQNPWVKNHLANFWRSSLRVPTLGRDVAIPSRSFAPLRMTLNNLLNLFLFRLQLRYMSRRRTTEEVNLHAAFFHPARSE